MGVSDKDARQIRAQSAMSRASEDALMEVGEYSVQESRRWMNLTVPQLVVDNCDVSSDDSVLTYCDFDNGFLVIDLDGGADE
jgi:hypothetical protein